MSHDVIRADSGPLISDAGMGVAIIGSVGRNPCRGRAKSGQIPQNRGFFLVGMPRAAVSVFLHPRVLFMFSCGSGQGER